VGQLHRAACCEDQVLALIMLRTMLLPLLFSEQPDD
jgi:hypothetical protein